MGEWRRHGECGHCGWCCLCLAHSVANVENPKGLTDPDFYRVRGFKLHHANGLPVLATARVWQYRPCPQFRPPTGAPGCAIYAERPKTCADFPSAPEQIVGTPCTYYFEREQDGAVERVGGLGSPHPTVRE